MHVVPSLFELVRAAAEAESDPFGQTPSSDRPEDLFFQKLCSCLQRYAVIRTDTDRHGTRPVDTLNFRRADRFSHSRQVSNRHNASIGRHYRQRSDRLGRLTFQIGTFKCQVDTLACHRHFGHANTVIESVYRFTELPRRQTIIR